MLDMIKSVGQRLNPKISHEMPYSDGEIYFGVRYHQVSREDGLVRAWRVMLSECKARALKHLLARPKITAALDKVMTFPGLRGGLQLGNIDKNLATHCDDMIIHYLHHTFRTWNAIIDADSSIRPFIDVDTVRLLEFRAPSASTADRAFILSAMADGILFRHVVDSEVREKLLRSLLAVQVVIPSIATLHENMKYMAIGAKVLHTYIDEPHASSCRKSTLKERLRAQWHRPPIGLIEVEEGRFRRLTGPACPDLAFKQLFVSVLRQFHTLSTFTPLRDNRREAIISSVHKDSLWRLLKRARILGYSNTGIRNGIHDLGHRTEGTLSTGPELGQPLTDWRGGKPFVRTILALQTSSFLPQLIQKAPMSVAEIPSAQFIQRDLIEAFFEKTDYCIDIYKPMISIDLIEYTQISALVPSPDTISVRPRSHSQRLKSTVRAIQEPKQTIGKLAPVNASTIARRRGRVGSRNITQRSFNIPGRSTPRSPPHRMFTEETQIPEHQTLDEERAASEHRSESDGASIIGKEGALLLNAQIGSLWASQHLSAKPLPNSVSDPRHSPWASKRLTAMPLPKAVPDVNDGPRPPLLYPNPGIMAEGAAEETSRTRNSLAVEPGRMRSISRRMREAQAGALPFLLDPNRDNGAHTTVDDDAVNFVTVPLTPSEGANILPENLEALPRTPIVL